MDDDQHAFAGAEPSPTHSGCSGSATLPLPPGSFHLILADPPWHFVTHSDKGQGRSPSRYYKTMHFDAIRRLPFTDIAAPGAGLALRVYGPMQLQSEAIDLMYSLAW